MIYLVPLRLGCKLASGVALAELSDAIELTDDKEDSTSDTGATPNDDSISSKSLFSRRNNRLSFNQSHREMKTLWLYKPS